MRLLGILIVVGIVGLLGWQILGNRVDRTDPAAVATAFTKALKGEKIKKASTFYVPDQAEAWREEAEKKIAGMRGDLHKGFFSGVPEAPVFTSAKLPKAPANELKMSAGDFNLDVRELDGKWHVCRAPL